MLKSILDSIVVNFRCNECTLWVQENNIEITSTAGSTLTLNVHCPHCSKVTLVKAEVNNIDLWNIAPDGSNLWEIKQKLWEKLAQMKQHIHANMWPTINDKEITDMRLKLKNENISAADLFGN